jgi:methyl-accepting chemotaxis protein
MENTMTPEELERFEKAAAMFGQAATLIHESVKSFKTEVLPDLFNVAETIRESSKVNAASVKTLCGVADEMNASARTMNSAATKMTAATGEPVERFERAVHELNRAANRFNQAADKISDR